MVSTPSEACRAVIGVFRGASAMTWRHLFCTVYSVLARYKGTWGSGGIAPIILNLRIK
jgi:hypothetical protein